MRLQRVVFAIGQLVLVVFGVLTALFFLIRISGDPADVLAGPNPTPQEIEAIRERLGLNRPLYEQYVTFMEQTVRLDFGKSYRYDQPAFKLVLDRLPATLTLAVLAIFVTIGLALPIGTFAATHRGSVADRLVMLFAAFGQAMPNFWLGIVLILIFAVWLRLLPSFGSGEPLQLILPVATLSASFVARMSRLVRSETLEVLGQDYIRTARAKGLVPNVVLFRHVLKNTLIPLVTFVALEFSVLFGGSVVIETVFAYNGMGRQLVEAIFNRDYPIVQATIFMVAIVVVLVNYFTDFVYRFVDPRVKEAT